MIIISGGTSGLGKAITEDLREKGNRVITLSRKSISSKDHFQCDISNYASLKSVSKKINAINEKVKVFINCAGIASMNLALMTPANVTQNLINTNLVGTIYTNQLFSPLIIKAGGGRIINFSTIAVSIALAGESIYVASKAGVEAFSRTLAKELTPFNITVNCIAPGPIKTNLIKGISEQNIKKIINQQIIQKEMNTNDLIDLVNLLLSKDSKNITGQVLHLGGY